MKLKDAVRREGPGYRNPARYRLDFIKENTFNRVWSVRMTRARVFLVSAAIIAGGAALLWVIIAYTPVRQLLPGALKGDLRAQYIETAVKLDSLEQAAARNRAQLRGSGTFQPQRTRPDSRRGHGILITGPYDSPSLIDAVQGYARHGAEGLTTFGNIPWHSDIGQHIGRRYFICHRATSKRFRKHL